MRELITPNCDSPNMKFHIKYVWNFNIIIDGISQLNFIQPSYPLACLVENLLYRVWHPFRSTIFNMKQSLSELTSCRQVYIRKPSFLMLDHNIIATINIMIYYLFLPNNNLHTFLTCAERYLTYVNVIVISHYK